jgi:hypothetical protein
MPPPIVEPEVSDVVGIVPEVPVAPAVPAQQEPPAAAPAASPPPPPVSAPKPSARAHMQRVVGARKQARLEKVVMLATEKRVITNDDVQKLLNVSDSTATRYLSELVKTGRLKRSGVRFHERYEPLGGSNSAV